MSLTPDQLQAILEAHPVDADGQCETCHVEGPCADRWAAQMTVASREQLAAWERWWRQPQGAGAHRAARR